MPAQKRLSIFLSFVLLLLFTALKAPAQENTAKLAEASINQNQQSTSFNTRSKQAPASSPRLGDVDADGSITARDADLALKMDVELIPARKAADVDSNGTVDSTDARLILRMSIGKGALTAITSSPEKAPVIIKPDSTSSTKISTSSPEKAPVILETPSAPVSEPDSAATSVSAPQVSKTKAPKVRKMILKIDNGYSTRNGPTKPTLITVKVTSIVRSITNYHWNNGQGKSPPGQIGLQNIHNGNYSWWKAKGLPGSGAAVDAYWYVKPDVEIDPGVYKVLDSDKPSWSCNAQSNGRGFTVILLDELSSKTHEEQASSVEPEATGEKVAANATPAKTGPSIVGRWAWYMTSIFNGKEGFFRYVIINPDGTCTTTGTNPYRGTWKQSSANRATLSFFGHKEVHELIVSPDGNSMKDTVYPSRFIRK